MYTPQKSNIEYSYQKLSFFVICYLSQTIIAGIHVSCQGCITSISEFISSLWHHHPLPCPPKTLPSLTKRNVKQKSIYPKDLQLKNIELLRIKVLGLNQVGLKFNHQIGWIITQKVTHSRIISIAWVECKILLIGNQVKLLKFALSIEKVMFDTTQGTYSKTWLYPLIFWIPLDLTFFWMVNLVTHFSNQKHISDLQLQRFKFSHLKHREFHSWTQIL